MGASSRTGLSQQAAEPVVSALRASIPSAGFTPGPWKIGRRSNGGYHHFISGSGWTDLSRVVTRMRGRDCDKPEGLANARLIAAAPELYEALCVMVEEKRDYMLLNSLGDPDKQHSIKTAKSALAKARGEVA